jgi:hypothetical protein
LEVSRGGNSHQSETNLIKKTPEAILPGALTGWVFRSERLDDSFPNANDGVFVT